MSHCVQYDAPQTNNPQPYQLHYNEEKYRGIADQTCGRYFSLRTTHSVPLNTSLCFILHSCVQLYF